MSANKYYNDGYAFIAVVIMAIMLFIVYQFGYYKRADDINARIMEFPNNQEECFTRQEVDSFIYGSEK